MDIRVFDNVELLSKDFADYLRSTLESKDNVTVALSGGSTPRAIFDYLAKQQQDDPDWRRIRLFWGDERCVDPEDNESNYKMTKTHLLDKVAIPDSNVFRIRGENEPVEEANRYSDVLMEELEVADGAPSFDLVLLGMGDDGHTASIFPHEMELWNDRRLCVVANHPETGQQRISITGSVINAAKRVAFLVTGENKAEKVKEIIENADVAAQKYPAALVNPQSGELVWFLDKKAAKLLKKQ